MAHSKVIQPKRKKRVYASRESPFPVPIATITREAASPNQWFYYTGDLHGNCVAVRHSGDMDFLYKMGFFGKGSMSRSKPEFNLRYRTAEVPLPTDDTMTTRVLSRRSYLRRLNWKLLESSGSTDEHVEYDSSQELPEEVDRECEKREAEYLPVAPSDATKMIQSTELKNLPGDQEEVIETDYHSDANLETSKLSKTDLWEDTEADEDFWGSETLDVRESKTVSKEWSGSAKCLNIKSQCDSDEHRSTVIQESHCSVDKGNVMKGDNCNITARQSNEEEYHSAERDDSTMIPCKRLKTEENERTSQEMDSQSEICNTKEKCSKDGAKNLTFTSNNSATWIDSTSNRHRNAGASDTGINIVTGETDKLQCETDSQSSEFKPESDTESARIKLQKEADQFDSLCHSDDEDGDIFVMEDSDSEPETKRHWKELKWKPVLKRDPFYIREYLHLSLEETFFLAYGLGCLIVYDEDKELLNLSEMWRTFCQNQESFLPKYIAYHYFRSKGWVPKSGLKFGADYIIYKEGPPFYHGSYSVLVRLVDEETLREDINDTNSRKFTWTSLAGLNRATEHVAKEVMMCFVIKPKHLTGSDLLSPKCISLFRVQEVVMSRWVSSQERENKTTEDMP